MYVGLGGFCFCFVFVLFFDFFVILWIIQFPGLGKKILGEESNEFTNELGKYMNFTVFLWLNHHMVF